MVDKVIILIVKEIINVLVIVTIKCLIRVSMLLKS